jgi:hypothetical protein
MCIRIICKYKLSLFQDVMDAFHVAHARHTKRTHILSAVTGKPVPYVDRVYDKYLHWAPLHKSRAKVLSDMKYKSTNKTPNDKKSTRRSLSRASS